MSFDLFSALLYGIPLSLAFIWYLRRQYRRAKYDHARLQQAMESGLSEPISLHPVVDPNRCLGSGACVAACPEKALGIINGKAQHVNPGACIGHGACAASCPHDAITLVFGNAKRGLDIPQVDPNFETNVPGIYIAGELGGMGLIRKAVEQGRQAIEAIRKSGRQAEADAYDVVIVGAGPAGLGAALAAKQNKLRYAVVEQEKSLGGSVWHYPRNKVVMTTLMELPLVGKVKMAGITKEDLTDLWRGVVEKTKLKIRFHERMEKITPNGQGYVVQTSRKAYRTRSVLLAIGRRGTPRKLGVPGEEQSKVVYRLVDAEQYRHKHVLVVGGGDSALEAVLALVEQPGTRVTLSYRGDAFTRAKDKNLSRLQEAESHGRVKILLRSQVARIEAHSVMIEHEGQTLEIKNDAVIICAGGILPTPFLKELGVIVETKYGTR